MEQHDSVSYADANPRVGQTLLEEMARAAGQPRDGWESLLSMDDERSVPVDHCAVLSEN